MKTMNIILFLIALFWIVVIIGVIIWITSAVLGAM